MSWNERQPPPKGFPALVLCEVCGTTIPENKATKESDGLYVCADRAWCSRQHRAVRMDELKTGLDENGDAT